MSKIGTFALLRLVVGYGLFASAFAASAQTTLQDGFKAPPQSARPQVWWHWPNGNISQQGVKADLDWMHRVGIGGVHQAEVGLGIPAVVPNRTVYMSPAWKDTFRYAATHAGELGMDLTVFAGTGWSGAGGPWVEPENGMKKIVWSETVLSGGQRAKGALAKPPSIPGPIGNFPIAGPIPPEQNLYHDARVVAVRLPDGDRTLNAEARITASGPIDAAVLSDGDIATPVTVQSAAGQSGAWIQFEFSQPQTVRAFTYASSNRLPRFGGAPTTGSGRTLQVSDDGKTFRDVATIPLTRLAQTTMAFAPVSGRVFRLNMAAPVAGPPAAGLGAAPAQPPGITLTELRLESGPRVHRAEDKAGYATTQDYYAIATPKEMDAGALRKADVVDITTLMKADGTLDWTAPKGRWLVLRMGYSLTGAETDPSPAEATGLEIDKLSRVRVAAYAQKYTQNLIDITGPNLFGKDKGVRSMLIDSWESGTQNWTESLPDEFKKRRGYDITPWLPALTGRVVESADATDRFLWDFRRTIGQMTADNFFGEMSRQAHARGLKLYAESHESRRAYIGDGMEPKVFADVPMGAMWTGQGAPARTQIPPPPGRPVSEFDLRESASVANLYGQGVVAAESLTSSNAHWMYSPWYLKPTTDLEMVSGVSRFVIHTSMHQPFVDDAHAPGLTLSQFGQDLTRNETWAEQAGPWINYLARSSYLLQQGVTVADIAYFYGEEAPITTMFAQRRPDEIKGYAYDFVNAQALLDRISAKDGRLTTRNGAAYRVLYLDPQVRFMTVAVLKKIRDLVAAGATVVGAKPASSPSLADNPAEFTRIVDELWNSGKIAPQNALAATLARLSPPDFAYTGQATLQHLHRRLPDGDIYYVSNRANDAVRVSAMFRVTGRAPEIWDPATGKSTLAGYRVSDGRMSIDLAMEPWESYFVVFRTPTTESSHTIAAPTTAALTELKGPWTVKFDPNRGAPASITLSALASWADQADPGVKYYSGAGTYSRTINAQDSWFVKGARIWLDLGDVEQLAEVSVNGKIVDVAWKPPFRVDITDALKAGDNQVDIKVVNLWFNRRVGDAQPGAKAIAWSATAAAPTASTPLMPSGLLGPVRIVQEMSAAR